MRRLFLYQFLAFSFSLCLGVSSVAHAADSEDGGQKIATKIASFVSKAIYNLDEDRLLAVLEIYLNERPEVRALTVTESIDQERLLTYFRQDDKAVYDHPIPDELLKLKRFSAVSMFDGEPVGTVEIFYADTSTRLLNAEEQAWVVDHPVISVGIEEWYPFVRTKEDGTPGGVAGDFLSLVMEKTGLRMKVIGDKWSTLLSDFKKRKIDLLPATYYTDDRAAYGLYGSPYFTAKEFLYIKQGDGSIRSFDDLAGKKLAIVKGFGTIPKIRKKFPGIEIVETENQIASMYAVLNGEVDAFYESQIVVDDLIRKELITGLKAIGQTAFDASKLHFFSRIDEPLLQSILAKGLASITEAERREIMSKFVGKIQTPGDDAAAAVIDRSLILKIGIGAVIIVVLLLIMTVVAKVLDARSSVRLYESKEIKGLGMMLVVLFLSIVVLGSWFTVQEAEQRTRKETGGNLKTILQSTHEILLVWADSKFQKIQKISGSFTLRILVENLLTVPRNKEELAQSWKLGAVRDFLKIEMQDFDNKGFFIISPDGFSIGSRRDANIGELNLIYKRRGDLLERAFKGETVLIPPIISDVSLMNDKGKTTTLPPTMFFAAPITSSSGTVIAVLTIRVDPARDFTRFTQLGRIGESGETYAFDKTGRLISESRFDENLREIGIIGKDENGILNVHLRDPGGNLLAGHPLPPDFETLPLTFMAAEATAGKSGVNVAGYRDYRGVPVMGAWLWDEKLGLGMATEIDVDEAMQSFSTTRYTVLIVLGVTVLIALVLGGLSIWIGRSANRSLHMARDNLERQVEERTAELAQTLSEQEAVMAAIDYGIIFMDADLRVRFINQAGIDIWEYDKAYTETHPTMADLIYHNRYGNIYPVADEEFDAYVEDRVKKVQAGAIPPTEVELANGRILRYQNIVLPDGGRMLTYLDTTKTVLAERKLKDAFNVISSSIDYASRIQRSILPDDTVLSAVMRDHFILWEPRDVVGGDIYWYGAWGQGCLIILGDCTGHGVPGAFMTLIAIGALERAMSEIEGGNVGKLVSRMHQYIQVTLSQHYEGGDSDDGIEVGACYFVPEEPQMTFVGARFELFVNEGGEISVVKGTKAGMGYRGIPYDQEYEEKMVDLKPDQSFYLTTDGLVDQVGGERNRMFGKKRFRKLLQKITNKPMNDQKENILGALIDYQGEQIRRDDVAAIGFRIS